MSSYNAWQILLVQLLFSAYQQFCRTCIQKTEANVIDIESLNAFRLKFSPFCIQCRPFWNLRLLQRIEFAESQKVENIHPFAQSWLSWTQQRSVSNSDQSLQLKSLFNHGLPGWQWKEPQWKLCASRFIYRSFAMQPCFSNGSLISCLSVLDEHLIENTSILDISNKVDRMYQIEALLCF